MAVDAKEIAAIPLFESLSAPDVEELATWFEPRTCGEGACLIGEGASGYSFFVIADGTAAVTSQGVDVATLGPGDFFGEIAIIGDGRRTSTVTTTSPAKVFVLFGTEFRRLQQSQPECAARIETSMRERLASN